MFNRICRSALGHCRPIGLLAVIGLLTATGLGFPSSQASENKNLVVVELFTSQGCNSCPPADAFLQELTGQENVLALSFPVDYWDYLGWKDTLADPAHTARQTTYRQAFGLRQIYTPQMVIQGRREGVGSRRRDIQSKISAVQDAGASTADVSIASTAEAYSVRVTPNKRFGGAAGVWLVFYDPVHEVDIKSGENGGRTLKYHNVVRGMMPLGSWSGADQTFVIEKAELTEVGEKCAILVQSENGGPILAAALMP